jgi:hypothetical protein
VVEHHSFAKDVDAERIEQSWQSWLARSFA